MSVNRLPSPAVLVISSVPPRYSRRRRMLARPKPLLAPAGACAGSIVWFVGLGYGAGAVAPLMSRPVTWRVLDLLIGLVMLAVAWSVATTHVAS